MIFTQSLITLFVRKHLKYKTLIFFQFILINTFKKIDFNERNYHDINQDTQEEKTQPQKQAKLNKKLCKLSLTKSDNYDPYSTTASSNQFIDEDIDLNPDQIPEKPILIGEFSSNFQEKFSRITEVIGVKEK